MPIEQLNHHTHDAGIFQYDWNYATDASVDLATQKLDAVAHDGVDTTELLDFVKSATDFNQVTDREARQLSAQLREHYDQMNPTAKKIADKFEATFQDKVVNLHDASDEALSGYNHAWYGESTRSHFPDAAVVEGDALRSFIFAAESIANPFKRLGSTPSLNGFSDHSSIALRV